ncbi:MAG: cupin [Alphaproteobacteria bacterium]|nr:cupin [Alphaproteobacteria bacterium]
MTGTGINQDLTRYAAQQTDDLPWTPSPSGTVWRKRLEHFGDAAESGHVTSVVRYDANSAFAPHDHPDGEEILVLDGVFSDEHGDYPAGTFLLNPTGFRHAPRSQAGCVLFVKLCQYAGADRPQITIDTASAAWEPHAIDGVEVLPLYRSDSYPENIRLVRFQPGVRFPLHKHVGGEEIFVIDGTLEDAHGRYEKGTWVRYPDGSEHEAHSPTGGTLYVKTGHLSR